MVFGTEKFNTTFNNSTTLVRYNVKCHVTMLCWVVVHRIECGLSYMHRHWNATHDIHCDTQYNTQQHEVTGNTTHNIYCDIFWCRCDKQQCDNTTFVCSIVAHCMVMCCIECRVLLSGVVSFVASSVSKLSKRIKHNINFSLPNILSVEFLL